MAAKTTFDINLDKILAQMQLAPLAMVKQKADSTAKKPKMIPGPDLAAERVLRTKIIKELGADVRVDTWMGWDQKKHADHSISLLVLLHGLPAIVARLCEPAASERLAKFDWTTHTQLNLPCELRWAEEERTESLKRLRDAESDLAGWQTIQERLTKRRRLDDVVPDVEMRDESEERVDLRPALAATRNAKRPG